MPIIQTADISPDDPISTQVNQQLYCSLDSLVMLEIHEALSAAHAPFPPIYAFSRALQAPYLDIMRRGFAVDERSRQRAVAGLREREAILQQSLDEMACAVWDKGLNPRSPAQLKSFFYKTLRLPEQWLSQKGERKLSTNREALENLDLHYVYARPFISTILRLRELAKQREVFEVELSHDRRLRSSYNISATETGRSSSSENAFGSGTNMQNVGPPLRYVFVADPGWKLCQIDGEQAEARDVGFLCGTILGDWSYLDAVEKYDLHTYTTKQVWPELPWTGDWDKDKKLASELIFYRDFSYRDMAKRGSHMSNYMGSAYTASRRLKMPLNLMEEFQARYIIGRDAKRAKDGTMSPPIIPAFPCIPRLWQWIAQEIQTKHYLITPFGRKRHFFGRTDDDATLREAIANLPQSMTADRMSLGMWRIWKHMPEVQLLGNGYDSVIFQFRGDACESEIVSKALKLCEVPLTDPKSGRVYVCPGEAKVGWNWGAQVTPQDIEKAQARGKKPPRLNLDGLVKWSPSAPDTRKRHVGLQRIA